jgi:hypothetical protein
MKESETSNSFLSILRAQIDKVTAEQSISRDVQKDYAEQEYLASLRKMESNIIFLKNYSLDCTNEEYALQSIPKDIRDVILGVVSYGDELFKQKHTSQKTLFVGTLNINELMANLESVPPVARNLSADTPDNNRSKRDTIYQTINALQEKIQTENNEARLEVLNCWRELISDNKDPERRTYEHYFFAYSVNISGKRVSLGFGGGDVWNSTNAWAPGRSIEEFRTKIINTIANQESKKGLFLPHVSEDTSFNDFWDQKTSNQY